MKDVVWVPAYERPEFLWLCLEQIAKADFADEHKFIVAIDDHVGKMGDSGNMTVVEHWKKEGMDIETRRWGSHVYHGNSYNVMNCYVEAFTKHDCELVYLVEEDVQVARDFFRWHRAIQGKVECFASIAVRDPLLRASESCLKNPSLYYTSRIRYASLGVCFRREKLQWIVPHAKHAYWSDMVNYAMRNFPHDRYQKEMHEQDGLIMRVIGQRGELTVWPYVGRCCHVGFFGYNRPSGYWQRANGNLEVKISATRGIISSEVELRERGPDFKDFQLCSLDGSAWNELILHDQFL